MSTRLQAEVELRPARVAKWLQELPLLNIADTGRRLHASLTAYNRLAIEPNVRRELLELYRYPVRQIAVELQKRYVGLPLPLADKAKSTAEASRDLHTEMAYGYKHLVLAEGDADPAALKPAARAERALAIQRAIRYLTDVLAISYTAYSPYPPGTWREIHALYRRAEQLGVTNMEIADPLNTTRPAGSIADAYKHALLLDFGDPYHLPARLTARCHQYLDRYAANAQLLSAPERFDGTCQFLIDPDSDRAGVAFVDEGEMEQNEARRLLNTIELARMVHGHLALLQQGRTPEPDGLPRDFYLEGAQELLRHLIMMWGVNPKRAFRRNAGDNARLDVAVGLPACHFWLHGGQRFVRSSNFVGPLPQRSAGASKTAAPEPQPAFEPEPWQLQDEGAGGMAMSKKGLVRAPVRVGDLIAARLPDEAEWVIAVVRWVKSANPSSVEIGTQRLAPSARAVLVAFTGDQKSESEFLPALLLPKVAALKQPESLVVQRGMYRPGRIIYIDDAYRLYPVRASLLIEVTSAFERFQLEIPEA